MGDNKQKDKHMTKTNYTKKEIQTAVDIVTGDDGFTGMQVIKTLAVIKKDKPEEGKVYTLTGGRGTSCISNGNTWKESEVKDD